MNINQDDNQKKGLILLISAAIATVIIWQIPFGNYIVYPFTILATWFHEMGHGLMAILLGGKFSELLIFANGSGIASHSGPVILGPLGQALIAAAGPMGPPIAGAALIIAGRRAQTSRIGLTLLGSLLLLSTVIWIRSIFGLIAIPLFGISILVIAMKGQPWLKSFVTQFLGVQACISTYHQIDYLFTRVVLIDGNRMLSDTGNIAQNLLLPYWFWALAITIFSFTLLIQSLRLTYFTASSNNTRQ